VAWTDVPRRNGHIYTGYLGDDKLLQISTENKSYKQMASHDGTTIFDYQKALPHIEEIWGFLQSKRVEFFGQLVDIGLTTKSKGWSSPEIDVLAQRKVGEAGGCTVWTNGNKVGLYGPDGHLATGLLTTKGKIRNVSVDYHYTNMEAKFTEVLAKAALYVMHKESGKFSVPLQVSADKKAAD
jgi:hypothetical protein